MYIHWTNARRYVRNMEQERIFHKLSYVRTLATFCRAKLRQRLFCANYNLSESELLQKMSVKLETLQIISSFLGQFPFAGFYRLSFIMADYFRIG